MSVFLNAVLIMSILVVVLRTLFYAFWLFRDKNFKGCFVLMFLSVLSIVILVINKVQG